MRTVSCIFLLILACRIMPAVDLFVAVDGNDSNPGSADRPFATIERARDEIRKWIDKELTENVTVYVKGGTYHLKETVVFTLEDSPPPGITVTYQAAPGEEAIFDSGVPITGWKKARKLPDGMPEAARDKVWVADMPKGLDRFFTLYEGDRILSRARSAGFKPLDREKSAEEMNSGTDLGVMKFPPEAMNNWPNLKDAELLLLPSQSFTMNILPLASVDEANQLAYTAIPGTYALGPQQFSSFEATAWLENIPDFLDGPGEWIVDTRKRKVYLWPEGTEPSEKIVAPSLNEYIRVQGDIDFSGPVDEPVRGLVFQGLSFTHGRRDLWKKNHKSMGLQHDWDMYDRGNALIRLRGAEDCAVTDCSFLHSSGGAVRLDLHCQRIRVSNNRISHIGGTGILISGYGPGKKNVSKNNEVINNHIHHVGLMYWQSPGIFITQSGNNRIAHNLIHNTPYNGLVVSGIRYLNSSHTEGESQGTVRWHEVDGDCKFPETIPYLHAVDNVIEYNELHDCMEFLEDGNGIYISGAGKGNLIRWNYLHDILGRRTAGAIRTDGCQLGTLIEGNIIQRCGNLAVLLKYENYFVNNIFADMVNNRGEGAAINYAGSPAHKPDMVAKNAKLVRNIFYLTDSDHSSFYTGGEQPAWLRNNEVDSNLYFNAADPQHGERSLELYQELGVDQNSIAADPLFINPDIGDFRLKPESPAFKLGFEPIDIKKIGLLDKSEELSVNVDWQEFISKQDMQWNNLPVKWEESPFLGNGDLGLMIYFPEETNCMKLDIGSSRVQDYREWNGEVSSHPRLPIGYFNVYPSGKILGGSMRLDLYNAVSSGEIITEKGKIALSAYVHALENIMIVELEFSGDENKAQIDWQQLPAINPLGTFMAEQYQGKGSRKIKQQIFNEDGKRVWADYTLNPEGENLDIDSVDVYRQPLLHGGSTSTAWSVKASETKQILFINISHDSAKTNTAQDAASIVNSMMKKDLKQLKAGHTTWWNSYYQKSYLSIPDKKLQSFYWIQLYKLASATRMNGALIDNQGPWLQETRWPGAWWNLNVQLSYWLCNASNHTELNHSLINTLSNNLQVLIQNVPEAYQYNSAGVGRSTGQIPSHNIGEPGGNNAVLAEIGNLPWACHNLWLHYRHTMDEEMLRAKLFPILKRAINYYIHFLRKDEAGIYHLPPTNSPEYPYDQAAWDGNFDLSLLKWGCQTLIEICEILDLDDPLLPDWKDIVQNLVEFPRDETGFLIRDNTPYSLSHRHYSHLLMIYPLYLVNVEQPGGKELIETSVEHWHSIPEKLRGYSYTGASSLYSSINEGDKALNYLNGLFSSFLLPNTLYKEAGGPVIETPLSGGQAIIDMMLQSWGGKIRVFPAVPGVWKDLCFHNLLAQGGFEVSAAREGGKTRFISVKSLAGEPCIIKSDLEGPLGMQCDHALKYKWLNESELQLFLEKDEEVLLYSRKTRGPFVIKDVASGNQGAYFGLPD